MLRYEGRFDQRELRLFEFSFDTAESAANVVAPSVYGEIERLRGGEEEPLALAARAFVDLVCDGVAAPSEAYRTLASIEILQRGEEGSPN